MADGTAVMQRTRPIICNGPHHAIGRQPDTPYFESGIMRQPDLIVVRAGRQVIDSGTVPMAANDDTV